MPQKQKVLILKKQKSSGVKPETQPEVKPEVKAQVKATNKAIATQQIIVRKEMKYIYPKGCILPEKRKAHRAKVRAALQKMESAIMKATTPEVKGELEAKYQVYKKEHLVLG